MFVKRQQYSCLKMPLSLTEAWQVTVHRVQRVKHYRSNPVRRDARLFFACVSSAPVRVECEQLLSLRRHWQRQVCRDTGCLRSRSHGLIRVFFQASCSCRSEGLFDQSISVAPPVQALRGLPCLGSLSVVWWVRHIVAPPPPPRLGSYSEIGASGIERSTLAGVLLCRSARQALKGAPWMGSYSEIGTSGTERSTLVGVLLCDQRVRHSKGRPGWGPTLRLAHQALKGAPWLGSYSVDQHVRHLKEHPGWGPTL